MRAASTRPLASCARARFSRIELADVRFAYSYLRDRDLRGTIDIPAQEAEALPLPDRSVDIYTIAFGLRNVTRIDVALAQIFMDTEDLCSALDGCLDVSRYLLDQSPIWLDDL